MPPASPVPAPALTGTDEVRPRRGRQPALREAPPASARGVRRRLEARLLELLERAPREPPVPRGLVHEIEDLIADAGPSGLEMIEEIAFEHRTGGHSSPLFKAHCDLMGLFQHASLDIGDSAWKLRFLERGYGLDALIREQMHHLAGAWSEYSLDLAYVDQMRSLYERRVAEEDDSHLREGSLDELDWMTRGYVPQLRFHGDAALWLDDENSPRSKKRESPAAVFSGRDPSLPIAPFLKLWDPHTEEDRALVALSRAMDHVGVSDIWMYFVPRERIAGLDGVRISLPPHYFRYSIPAVARHCYLVEGDINATAPAIQSAVDEGLHRGYAGAALWRMARELHPETQLNPSRILSSELRRAALRRDSSRPSSRATWRR